MKDLEKILVEFTGVSGPITEHDKKFYNIRVGEVLKLMKIVADKAYQEGAVAAQNDAAREIRKNYVPRTEM